MNGCQVVASILLLMQDYLIRFSKGGNGCVLPAIDPSKGRTEQLSWQLCHLCLKTITFLNHTVKRTRSLTQKTLKFGAARERTCEEKC